MAADENVRKDTWTNQEMEALHADDIHAAGLVVGLMSGVFLIGLFLYAFIWWVVRF